MSLKGAITRRDFERVKGWLKEKVHKWGSTYAPKDLQMRAFGEAYNPERLLSYLEDKFLG
jgi:carboxypeptidase Taq